MNRKTANEDLIVKTQNDPKVPEQALSPVDGIIDFGTTPLFQKYSAGENLSQLSQDRDLTQAPGPIGSSELDFLMQLLKKKRSEAD
jgi:hypothetical protein